MKNILKTLVLTLAIAFATTKIYAQVSVGIGVSVRIAPPAIPVYTQPPCPVDGYLWTPGYWAYDDADGYYWVPGVWIAPPHPGLLWTPGYWGYEGGLYGFHAGYWGPHIGFYGGVNYGFGYGGVGFIGGEWHDGAFRYNTAVVNVNTTVVHNTYIDRTVINNTTVVNNRASFNGPGGVNRQPLDNERQAMNEQHVQPTGNQLAHEQTARQDPGQRFSANHGMPTTTAMNRVNGRAFNQQGRIANGIKNGSMSAGETRNIESREANVNHEVHADRQANGGALTPQQRQHINQQQNNMSRAIYNDRHNANNGPRPQQRPQVRPQQRAPQPRGGEGEHRRP
ncbi:MAG: YXWGXW repeat-containing protein [Mucilaginibacter sp.]